MVYIRESYLTARLLKVKCIIYCIAHTHTNTHTQYILYANALYDTDKLVWAKPPLEVLVHYKQFKQIELIVHTLLNRIEVGRQQCAIVFSYETLAQIRIRQSVLLVP